MDKWFTTSSPYSIGNHNLHDPFNASYSEVSRLSCDYDPNEFNNDSDYGSTVIEQLLARLYHHGVRRSFCNEASFLSQQSVDAKENSMEEVPIFPGSTSHSSHIPRMNSMNTHPQTIIDFEKIRPYFYVCIPCDLQLSPIITSTPSMEVLLKIHFHVSSASHRGMIPFLEDSEMESSSELSPLVNPSRYFSFFVNGIRTLVPKRPGCGDIFEYLPHDYDLSVKSIEYDLLMDKEFNEHKPTNFMLFDPLSTWWFPFAENMFQLPSAPGKGSVEKTTSSFYLADSLFKIIIDKPPPPQDGEPSEGPTSFKVKPEPICYLVDSFNRDLNKLSSLSDYPMATKVRDNEIFRLCYGYQSNTSPSRLNSDCKPVNWHPMDNFLENELFNQNGNLETCSSDADLHNSDEKDFLIGNNPHEVDSKDYSRHADSPSSSFSNGSN